MCGLLPHPRSGVEGRRNGGELGGLREAAGSRRKERQRQRRRQEARERAGREGERRSAKLKPGRVGREVVSTVSCEAEFGARE